MGRITNFRNWVPELYNGAPRTILALEFWCNDSDAIWQTDSENLVKMASQEMEKTGLLKGAKILDGYVHPIKRCYPVYSRGYKKPLLTIQNYLDGFSSLTVLGRYGSFKYNNQDHSILMGLLAAEAIRRGEKPNLWSVNTDYESYQESTAVEEAFREV